MKVLFLLLLLPIQALCQPKLALLPPVHLWMEENRILRFNLTLTNHGNQPLLLGDKAKNPERFVEWGPNTAIVDFYEVSLSDRTGNVLKSGIFSSSLAFKNVNKPSVARGEAVKSIEHGALNLQDVGDGIFTLSLRANPTGLTWPRAYFDEVGAHLVFGVYNNTVFLYKPPRPSLAKPPTPPHIIARYKAMKIGSPPIPFQAPRGKGLYRGRVP